ncbi:MAG: hypothetical protein MJ222_01230 [Bacilli bacterium]|nr:hypothetical protein [Bacilli bacterium]
MKTKAHILTGLSLCAFLVCSCACNHEFTLVNAKEASFYEDGNIAYYTCGKCDKYFNENKKEIDKNSVKTRLPLFDTLDRESPISLFGSPLELSYDAQKVKDVVDESNAMISKINSGVYYKATEAQNVITKMNEQLDFLKEQFDIANLLADASGKAEDYQKQDEIYNDYYKMQDQYYGVYVALAKEGSYNNLFFKSYTEEQIQKFIKDHTDPGGGGTSGQGTSKKIQNLLDQYKAGKVERFEAYSQLVSLSNQLASEKSYANYLDYAYRLYQREYKVSDALDLSQKVIENINPLYTNMKEKLSNSEKDAAVKESNNKLSKNFFGKNMDLLRNYAKDLGSDYKVNFQKLFEEGRYYFSDVYNPNTTAYTANFVSKGNVLFLSKDYQSLSSLVHEFGHFNAHYTFGDSVVLDLSETQSKGNELLFLSYFKNSNSFTSEIKAGYTYDTLCDSINALLLDFAVNELEYFAYNNSFDQTSLENKWVELLTKYGATISRNKFDYMYQVLLNYRGYYVSYGVSELAALQLFAKGLTDFNVAANAYKSIYTKDGDSEKFKKSLENAGLFDVFSDDSFTLINTIRNI